MKTLLFFVLISLVPKASLACDDDASPPRSTLTAKDSAGEFTIEFEPDRVVSVTIDGNPVPAERLAVEDGRCSVTDEHGTVVLEVEVSKDGGIRWKSRRSRVVVGLTMGDVEEALAAHLGVDSAAAVLITDLLPDGPAARAGLARFDVVVAVDGKTPASRESLQEAVAAMSLGDTLTLEVRRRGERATVSIIGEPPGAPPAPSQIPFRSDLPLLDQVFVRSREAALPALVLASRTRGLENFVKRNDNLQAWISNRPAATQPPTIEDRLDSIEAKLTTIETLFEKLVSEHTPR